MTDPFVKTEEKCGTCNRKLVIDRNKHFVCLKCERMHPCLNSGSGFKGLNARKAENKSSK